MLFAKVSENDEVLEWPLTENMLRYRLWGSSLPEVLTDESLSGTGFVTVPPTPSEEAPLATKDLCLRVGALVKTNEGWRRQYVLEPVQPQEYESRLASKWKEIREKRDALMQEMDWRVLRYQRQVRSNVTPTDDIAVLDAYMNALADITNEEDPFLVTFPEKP